MVHTMFRIYNISELQSYNLWTYGYVLICSQLPHLGSGACIIKKFFEIIVTVHVTWMRISKEDIGC